jgi:hypothetical protein
MLDVGGGGGDDGHGGPDPRLYLATYGMVSLSGKPIGLGSPHSYMLRTMTPFRPRALWVWPVPGTLPIVQQILFGHQLQTACPAPAVVCFRPTKSIAEFAALVHGLLELDPCCFGGHALKEWPGQPPAVQGFSVLNVGDAACLDLSEPVIGYAFWGEALLPAPL